MKKQYSISEVKPLEKKHSFLKIAGLLGFIILFVSITGYFLFLPEPEKQPSNHGISGVALCSTTDAIMANKTSVSHNGSVPTPVGTNISGLKKWSVGSTWGGSVPQSGDVVTIPSNSVVVLDQNVNVKAIKIEGKLIVDLSKNINISAEYIYLTGNNAYFEWGTESQPYTRNGVITLRGGNRSTKIPGTTINYKGIVAANGAKLELHGNDSKQSWSQLGSNARPNQNKITLKDGNSNWSVGDEILIVSSRKSWNEGEKRRITAVSGDGKTFTLNSNLRFPHIGKTFTYTRQTDGKTWVSDMRAEVGLLSKSIKIQGDTGGDDFGGHIMIHSNSVAHVEDVELFRMGQKKILGRYPFHWHLLEEKGNGQYLKNTSIHTSFNRAITIHGTESTLVEGNFCYDHIGHGLFLEDGSERFNTIKNNVVGLSKRPRPGDELTPSDNEMNEVQNRTPSQYWITNPNNIFEGNVAAGTEGTGFWFAFPDKPLQQSSVISRFSGIRPSKEKLGVFKGNKSHSCKTGFDIFDRLRPNHSIIRNASWDRTDERFIDQHTFYGCDLANYGGIGGGRSRTQSVIFRDNIYSDNTTSLMHANYSTIFNSVFIANSGENVFSGERKLNRGYDGACTIKDCHLVGWDAANANYVQNTGGANKHTNYRIEGITLSPDKSVRMSFPNYSTIPRGGVGANAIAHPRFWSYIHWDKDGSLSGKANTSIVTNHPLCRDGTEVRYANWNNLFRTDRRFAYMTVKGGGNPKMSIVRTKSGTPKAGQYYINTDGNGFYGQFIQFPVMVNDGFLYTLRFDRLSSDKKLTVRMANAYTSGDEVLYRIKDFGRLGGLNISNATEKNSLDEVKSSNTSAWVDAGNDIYLKMKVGNNPDIRCDITWSSNITLPMLDTDGDGKSDNQESKDGTDPVGNGNIPTAQVIPWVPGNTTPTNLPPTGSFEAPTFSSIEEGYDRLYFKVNASDPNEGDVIRLTLFIDNEEIRTESGFPYEWGHVSASNPAIETETVGLEPGDHEFKVVITDDKGASVTITKVITVTERGVTTYEPIHDAYTQGTQGKNDGDLRIENGNRVSYLMFDLSGIESGSIQQATLELTVGTDFGNGTLKAYSGLGDWTETAINSANAPSKGLLLDTKSGDFATGSKLTFDVKDLTVVDGKATVIIEMDAGGNDVSFGSKDQTAISKPSLRVKSGEVVSVQEKNSVSLIKVYPNPSQNGVFYLTESLEWKIYSVEGYIIKSGEGEEIDLSSFNNGTYFLKSGNEVKMLVK